VSKNMSQQTPCGPKHHIERQKCSFWSIISIFGHFLSTGGSETENFKFFLQNMKSSGDFVSENMLQSNFLGESFFPYLGLALSANAIRDVTSSLTLIS
jgi:hypothetical protein